jgi:hypothetical protein
MVDITMRRVFRVLYCLVAAATLAGLPVLIIDFKNHDWSVHYKVCADAPARAAWCTLCWVQVSCLL